MKASYLLRLTSLAFIAYISGSAAHAAVLDFNSFTIGEIAGQGGWTAGIGTKTDGVNAYTVSAVGVDDSNGLRITHDNTADDDFSSVFWTPGAAFLGSDPGSDLINANGGQQYAYSFDIDFLSGSTVNNKTSIRIFIGGAVQPPANTNNPQGYAAISISDTGIVSRYGETGVALNEGFNTISGVIDFASLTQTVFVNGNQHGTFDLGVLRTVPTDSLATFGQVGIIMRIQDLDLVIDNFSVTQVPEPSVVALVMGLAGMGVVLLRRRRK